MPDPSEIKREIKEIKRAAEAKARQKAEEERLTELERASEAEFWKRRYLLKLESQKNISAILEEVTQVVLDGKGKVQPWVEFYNGLKTEEKEYPHKDGTYAIAFDTSLVILEVHEIPEGAL